MKQFIMLICSLALLAGCKKSTEVENEAGPAALLSGTAPNPYPVEPDPSPPCPNTYEPGNNDFPGPLIDVPNHPDTECAFILSSYCAAGDADNWRFNDPNWFDHDNVIMIKVGNSLPKPVYRVTITSTVDNSIRSDGIVNMGTGTYTSLETGGVVRSTLCLTGNSNCHGFWNGFFTCITYPFFSSLTHPLDYVSVRITNMNSQGGFCYKVYTQYVGAP